LMFSDRRFVAALMQTAAPAPAAPPPPAYAPPPSALND
jgi:hypothetical protein